MSLFPDFCRPLQPGEDAAAADLVALAFGGTDEVRLMDLLRQEGSMVGEMVLPLGEALIGYYALSVMRGPKDWLCLAPVAIHPEHQGRGHGRRMIGQLTEWARIAGQTVVVLGQPEFYESAGFSRARAARLSSPYPITHTLLAGPGEDVPEETLIYPKAFDRI